MMQCKQTLARKFEKVSRAPRSARSEPNGPRSRLHPSDGVFISMTMYNEDDARRLEEYRLLL